MEKYKVTLTVEERQALDRMVSSGKAAARKLVHARILLLAHLRHHSVASSAVART